ncbi:MAG: T9SS type A sorting domain-containing protein [Bacteroidales bacterium]|nr:T9SS type A sorting domain-containing protein [Candidatus Latescibacterota bacterium]
MKATRLLPVISLMCTYLAIVSTVIATTPTPAGADWLSGGVRVCMDTARDPQIVSDGGGGAFVAWKDSRGSSSPIYAQRIDGSGNPYWTVNGLQISDTDSYYLLELLNDGVGGAIAVYSTGSTIWAQRFDSDGNRLWGWGVEVTGSLSLIMEMIKVVPDGLGGFVTVFKDEANIYAQRVDSNGDLSWDEVSGRGAVVFGDFTNFDIVSDGMGGVFVAGYSDPSLNVFVQRVYASGAIWQSGGLLIPDWTGNNVSDPVIAGNGYDGVIVAWLEDNYGWDVKAQRIDPAGNLPPGDPGESMPIYLCEWYEDQHNLAILSDGSGGAYVAWEDNRDTYGYTQVYAQHVDKYRTTQWADNGILFGHDMEHQTDIVLFESGGECFATWLDMRWDEAVVGQKFDAGGSFLWTEGGEYLAEVSTSDGYDSSPDGAGGIFVTMTDDQVPDGQGLYVQSVDYKGDNPVPHPTISSVTDVPVDQGGAVRLTVDRSDYDDPHQVFVQVARYDVWQRVDGTLYAPATFQPPADVLSEDIIAEVGENIIIESSEGRFLLTAPTGAIPAGTWELVGSFDAAQSDEYIYRTSTLADSSATGIPYNVYVVSAHTKDPAFWYISEPDSGYSVDNLAPAPPLGLAGEQSQSPTGLELSWDENLEDDLWYYAVYRGTSETFIPGSGNLVATPEGEYCFDSGWDWQQDYWYKLSAVDENGNESGYITMGPGDVTGEDPQTPPLASYLSQNYPNPFNPSTAIQFGLSHSSRVSLKIYNVSGKLVRVVVEESRPAGHYNENWDGKDESGRAVASGVYFYRLSTTAFTENRKMILLR